MINKVWIIRRVTYFLTIILFGYILISQIFAFLSINIINFDHNLGNREYLKILLIMGFLSAGSGMILDKKIGEKAQNNFFSEDFKTKIVYLISASFLSYFFVGSGDFRILKNFALFGLIFIFLLYFLPNLVYFFVNQNLNQNYTHHDKKIIKNIKTSKTIAVISTFIVIGVFIFITNVIVNNLSGKANDDPTHKNQLYIQSIDPKTTTLTQKVTITGYNFGWKTNATYKLMTNDGEISQTNWTNEKIEFTVPLSVKTGKNELWIVRPHSEPSNMIEESNHMQMRVVDRFAFFPVENEPKWKRVIKRIYRYFFFDIKILNDYLY